MDELFEDEFELEFEELLEDEFELEFEELFEDELELELLDELELELDELFPATMISPSLRPVVRTDCLDNLSPSANEGCSLASAAEPTNAARPAARAVVIHFFVMPITPLQNRTCSSVRWSNGRCATLFHHEDCVSVIA
ncbi:hypothetical protein [Ensifer aridi]|uniref:hypothetical protein n=1 Tax=Ensifer aridi TaxID=1708715 RepID=UPI0006149EC5|nr:hypothetical protein [Ensifer aridi]